MATYLEDHPPACAIEECTSPSRSRGWCRAHYLRWYKYGDPLTRRDNPTPTADRFWDKVDTSGDCWLWTAGVNATGYGRLQLGGRSGGVVLAHRFAWQLATGIDPGNLCVLHLCDNPPCVNPDHLVLGTQAANVLDMVNKGRQKGKH